ncbi:hypothetical protein [uncultured Cohaesibacter sp.]|uniref:hypothetical protein n=1 Tax=uncultured Cohaesibacter sp. TaxID=1002546 RepID=UPI0029C6366D|nr:hypothetical protein [uncultured Cohaesibacter sp.]
MKTLILMRSAPTLDHSFSNVRRDDVVFCPSYYGDRDQIADKSGPYFHHYLGGKWTGIFDFFRCYPNALDEFDYFWFVDDDILAEDRTMLDFIDCVVSNRFQLAQPALTANSYWAHRITLVNNSFTFRNTNFVELMMPMMSRDFLRKVLPLFEGREAALGIDLFWHQLADHPRTDVAIIDAAPMFHSRPRREFLKSEMLKRNNDINQEKTRTIEEFSVRDHEPVVFSGQLVNGNRLERGAKLMARLSLDLLKISRHTINRTVELKDFRKFLVHQVFGRASGKAFDKEALDALMMVPVKSPSE